MIFYVKGVLQIVLSFFMSIVLTLSTAMGLTAKPSEKKDASEYGRVKNVIMLIGDGMGPLHLEKTKQERGISLAMDTFPYQGRSMTRSASNAVTDSAAGGTALSCGTRTYNSGLAVYMYDPFALESRPLIITELCHDNGMKTGVVTSDLTSGATPASYTVHTSTRGNTEDISTQQLESDFDLIWGHTTDYVTKEAAEENGFTFVTTYSEMMAVESGERSFAQFDNDLWHTEQADDETPTLTQMSVKAIDVLDDTDEGFFLMIEGAHIDKNSHNNNDEGMTDALAEFDKTVAAALDYAEKDGNTLVVVSADHETGGIVLNEDGTYSFTRGDHSDANVPVLVYGSDTFIENGEVINNYEIPQKIAYSLGFTESQFPKEVFAGWTGRE